ncbi:metal ABC transporter permease [Actinobacteria bacterium YIM 96077]|uniref:Metal ABC transporter permease n=1 Tax=Phytoactinopolyspora halophila TaxID=1981511 RepID=A0A329QEV8_9ACTN|nr:metal ABC transporter permease [Phytoactinopolyspora halophila]AYY15597.1 metal ABC transporter permease [Actinobacteria bacterium YIM 96077]RAW11013.1 metal ABC transporter permease [Phytoactinopolyspora halophila]
MNIVTELLSYDFMRRALIAALLTGLAAPAVGAYLVHRRLALMGDGIGHVALTGVAVGLLTGWAPVWTAVVVAIAGSITIELVRAYGKASADVALAMLFYGGIAGGVLLTGLAGSTAATLNTYLFGSITTVSPADLWVIGILAAVVAALAVGLAPQLFAICQDEEFARATGMPARLYSILIAVMAAVTVAVAMRTVGLLLVSALMVVPVATAMQLTRGFRTTFLLALTLGVVPSLSGVVFAFHVDVAPGASIVVLALAGFVLSWPLGTLVRRMRAREDVAGEDPRITGEHIPTEDHPHEHDDECGHPAVVHGDHTDYLHDGHLHAPHGRHYDEH